MLWVFSIQSDRRLGHNKPDIFVHKRSKGNALLLIYRVPFDGRIAVKVEKKVEKYQDLKCDMKKIWKCKNVILVPIVIGAPGTPSKNFSSWMD